jgi:hypothetical protein
MTASADLDTLNKRCERGIARMSDAGALAHIGLHIDAWFGRPHRQSTFLGMECVDSRHDH